MSTYLVAFVVGPLEATEPVDVDGIPLRLVHVPGKGHLTAFGLEVGAFALRWFQDYYGIPYPGDKVDLVALPDFAAGAMENLGCITFRESLLLVDPATSTQAEQQLVADVVTPRARPHVVRRPRHDALVERHLAQRGVRHVHGGRGLRRRPARLEAVDDVQPRAHGGLRDRLRWPAPARGVRGRARPPTREGMFDVLTYQKGGALLRMLEQYLGEERFRDGIHHYLRTHSYGNTETGDLWDAIEVVDRASRSGGSWTAGSGRRATRSCRRRSTATTSSCASSASCSTRRRERSEPVGRSPCTSASAPPGPMSARRRSARSCSTATNCRSRCSDPTRRVVVNAGGHGFFRVAYDDALRSRLTGAVVASMSTVERYSLVDDTWAAVVCGRLPATAFLDWRIVLR